MLLKSFAFLASLLFCLAGYSQSLEITIAVCRNEKHFAYLDSFNLYKGESLYGTYPVGYKNMQKLHLDTGTYRIEYQSLFGKQESVPVTITEKKAYSAHLCLDKLDYGLEKYVPVIDKIGKGQSYGIEVYSSGCFHNDHDTLVIVRKRDHYVAFFEGKSKTLDQSQLDAVRHFELEMNCLTSGDGCTTTTTYEVKYQGETVNMLMDMGCSWDGWRYLLQALGWKTY